MTSMNLRRTTRFSLLALLLCTSAAQAGLVIAPVFNLVEGTGPSDISLGLIEHTPLRAPGEHFAYVSGDPRAPALDTVHFWNDSSYNITGFSLQIVGSGTDTDDPSTIVIGDKDAVFGDVEGYPISSDIFAKIEISEDGKSIDFSEGVIPPGARFTDLHYADSDLVPEIQAFDYAAVDSWFHGELVPEPSSLLLATLGLLPLLTLRRRR